MADSKLPESCRLPVPDGNGQARPCMDEEGHELTTWCPGREDEASAPREG